MSKKKEGIRLSYSAHSTYRLCSEKFRLERILKLVPLTIATPLFFGSACDSASEVIFKAKKKSANGKFETKFSRDEMIAKFKDALTIIDYQGEKINITKSTKVKYSKADVQPELLEKEDKESINQFLAEKELEVDSIEDYIEYFKEKKDRLDELELEVYNYMAWFCLYRKGIMMLDRLTKWANENIIEVISVQNYFKLENDEGDVLSGLSDLEAILKDKPGVVRTLDLKTATGAKKSYPDGCIDTAEQLHIYSSATGNDEVGYIILEKAIKVREPRVQIREVYGTVNDEQRDAVFNSIDETLQNVKLSKFEKNKDACYSWGKCLFFEYCWKGDRSGLVDRIYAEKKPIDTTTETK